LVNLSAVLLILSGLAAEDLCAIAECLIVHFMMHDRVAFGGALMAVGVLYFWLAEFPLRARQAWAWWTLLVSGLIGFGSFLAYVGYGYLDSWHGIATLALLPVFVGGMARTAFLLRPLPSMRVQHCPPGARISWSGDVRGRDPVDATRHDARSPGTDELDKFDRLAVQSPSPMIFP
jgi:hypothetical protein